MRLNSEGARPGRPAWQAPIAGAAFVTLIGLQIACQNERDITLQWLAGHAGIGALIGLLVLLCDGPGPGTLLSRFLALISPFTMLLPVAGVLFNVAAYVTNRNHPGMYRSMSRLTLGISLIITTLTIWLL